MADLNDQSQADDDEIAIAIAKAKAKTQQPDNSWSGFGREAVRSAGEGIASLGDIGPQAYTLGKNALRAAGSSLANIPTELSAAWNAKSGELPNAPKPAPTEVDPTPTFYRDIYNSQFPVTPGYENSWTREVGNVAGPTLLTLGVGSAPAIIERAATAVPKVLADTALTTTGTVAGKEGGGAAGQYFGGDAGRRWGEALGGLFGGFTTPIVRGGTNVYLRSKLTDEQSPQRLNDAAAAGVTPDISLVGSPTGVAAAKQAPGYAAVRNAQQDQIDEALREAARARANRGQGPTLPISEPDIGKNVANTATEGANAAHADADLIFGNMSKTAGRNTPIDDSIVQRTLDNLRRTRSAVAQPTIDYYQNLLDAERQRGGLTWDAALEHRALARPSDSALSFDKNTHDAIAAAYTDALRNRAGQVGYTPQEFDAVNAQYGGLKT